MQRQIPIALACILSLVLAACSTQTRDLPSTKPPASNPATPGVGSTPGVMPPAISGGPGAEGTAAPAPELKLQEYQGQVKKSWSEGPTQFEGIQSDFRCTKTTDCTSTKYYNAPSKDSDCTCAAPCTPYVVNVAEKDRREAANKRLCDTDDWYGVNCPAPDCSFIEFEGFRCVNGKCAGLAMGKTQ